MPTIFKSFIRAFKHKSLLRINRLRNISSHLHLEHKDHIE